MVAGFLVANAGEVRSAVRELGGAIEELLRAIDAGHDATTRLLERWGAALSPAR